MDKMMGVEPLEHIMAAPAGKRRHVVDVRLVDHRSHGRIDVASLELVPDMSGEQCDKVIIRTKPAAENFQTARMGEAVDPLVERGPAGQCEAPGGIGVGGGGSAREAIAVAKSKG